MKRRLLPSSLLILCLGLCMLPAVNADVTTAVNYQGYLTDDTGVAIALSEPANRNVEFRLFTQAAGGAALWGEAQTATVYQGNFSVILGNGVEIEVSLPSGGSALRDLLVEGTETEFYIEISLDGVALTPRQRLTTTPFAFHAQTAVNASLAANADLVENRDLVDDTGYILQTRIDPVNTIPIISPSKIAQSNGLVAAQLATGSVESDEIKDGTIARADLIAEILNSLVPPGAVMAFAGKDENVPSGYVICDGRFLNKSEYPELFDAIGNLYGGTSGGTTFAVPDYRGRFLRGVSQSTGRDPNVTSRTPNGESQTNEAGSVQNDTTRMPRNAFYTSTNGNHSHGFLIGPGDGGPRDKAADGDQTGKTVYTNYAGNHSHSIYGGDSETRPINIYVNYIIRTGR